MKDYYTDLSKERFDEIMSAYADFLSKLDDVNALPVKVYKPLAKKNIDEILMLREMSKGLQNKKDEDITKAAQAASEAAEEAEKAQEKAEENPEKTEDKPEVEKEN